MEGTRRTTQPKEKGRRIKVGFYFRVYSIPDGNVLTLERQIFILFLKNNLFSIYLSKK